MNNNYDNIHKEPQAVLYDYGPYGSNMLLLPLCTKLSCRESYDEELSDDISLYLIR